jgi:asparagine synthase (glutamine-hydrolysing)
VLLRLYEERGRRMLPQLRGRFALALWDGRSETLLCARDRAGQKPLYYALPGGSFVFASEPKAILTHAEGLRRLDLRALVKHLAFDYVPPPDTLFEGIKQLPAGHLLTVDSSGDMQVDKYWEIGSDLGEEQSLARTDEQTVCNNLLALLREATRRRAGGDAPLGAFLSGGIDSSTLVAMMVEVLDPADINTFSIKFEEASFDESQYADEVITRFGTKHKRLTVTAAEVKRVLPAVVRLLDEPFGDVSVFPRYLLTRFAREHVGAAFSGLGGDELFGGYPAFFTHRYGQWMQSVPSGLANAMVACAERCLPFSSSNFGPRFLVDRLLQGMGHEPEIMAQIWHGSFNHKELPMLMRGDLGLSLSNETIYDELLSRIAGLSGHEARNFSARLQYFYFHYFLHSDLAKSDRVASANGLEIRAPLLDEDFVAYASSLEPRLKVRGLTTKYILRQAMKDRLPEAVLKRQKRGLSVPVAGWLRDGLQDMLVDVLSPERLKSEGLFNPAYVEQLKKEHITGARNHGKKLWSLLMFELWYEEHCRAAPDD